jgi:ATP-binding cassette subfamily D (ALD) long-chain fatty acid import protein
LDTVINDINSGTFIKGQVNSEILEHYTGGNIKESEVIEFTDIPIITPNGDILINKMNFEVILTL